MIEIPVNLGARSYPILVGAGALASVGTELARRKVGRKVVLISDAAITALHGKPVIQGLRDAGFETPPGRTPSGSRSPVTSGTVCWMPAVTAPRRWWRSAAARSAISPASWPPPTCGG
jgi:3-dehydroquinate synthase